MIPNRPTSKKVVLCIDDDQNILLYEKALLERSGYAVLTAVSSQQGLRLVTTCDCDAVLMDYDMTTMDGYDFALEIKRILPHMIIVMISGSDVPFYTLALVDALIPKVEIARELMPMITGLCCLSQSKREQQEDFSTRIANNLARYYPGGPNERVTPALERREPMPTRKEDS
jgi:CheY-like chemotaxis protein